MSRVFSSDWVGKVQRQYKDMPSNKQPAIYRLANDAILQDLREEIEAFVADMPEAQGELIVSKLHSRYGFEPMRQELIVGMLLDKVGFDVEYEEKIDGIMPDWTVSRGREDSMFIVEVVSDKVSRNNDDKNNMSDLLALINRIQSPYCLGIGIESNGSDYDRQMTDKTVEQVRTWITEIKPALGDKIVLGKASFEVIYVADAPGDTLYSCGNDSFWLNEKRLREKIENKIKKYTELVNAHRIPLVIAVVSEPSTKLSFKDFQKVVSHHVAYRVTYNEGATEPHGLSQVTVRDGLFSKYHEVSACLWVHKKGPGYEIRGVTNPDAAVELDDIAASMIGDQERVLANSSV